MIMIHKEEIDSSLQSKKPLRGLVVKGLVGRGLDSGSFRVLDWGGLRLRDEFGTVGYEFIIKLISEGSIPDTICIQKPSKQDSTI